LVFVVKQFSLGSAGFIQIAVDAAALYNAFFIEIGFTVSD
jgi:hypothetical protein